MNMIELETREKMTEYIAYHKKTLDLAAFESNGEFWIGSYSKFVTHQNGEPPYLWIEGNFPSKEAVLKRLEEMTGEEF